MNNIYTVFVRWVGSITLFSNLNFSSKSSEKIVKNKETTIHWFPKLKLVDSLKMAEIKEQIYYAIILGSGILLNYIKV